MPRPGVRERRRDPAGGPRRPRPVRGGLQALPGGVLEGPHALPGVGEGAEELRVGPDPAPAERPEALLLPAHGPREGLGGAGVVLGLLAHDLDGVVGPVLDELGAATLELQQPHAGGEELLGGPGVVLLELHELPAALGEPHAPALGGGEVLRPGPGGGAVGLCHLIGRAGGLVYVLGGGFHRVPPWLFVSACYYVLTTHMCGVKPRGIRSFLLPLFTRVRGRIVLGTSCWAAPGEYDVLATWATRAEGPPCRQKRTRPWSSGACARQPSAAGADGSRSSRRRWPPASPGSWPSSSWGWSGPRSPR